LELDGLTRWKRRSSDRSAAADRRSRIFSSLHHRTRLPFDPVAPAIGREVQPIDELVVIRDETVL